MCACITSCVKDEFTPPPDPHVSTQNVDFRSTTTILGNGAAEQLTVLGAQRANPYTVTVMTHAWNNLYDQQVLELPATHLYLRFMPEDYEDLRLMDEAGLEFSDYPLDYEVLHLGTHYEDPSVPEGAIPYLYITIGVNETIPEVPYEILAELLLAPYESYLTAEAFRLTNNDYYYSKGDSVVSHNPRNPIYNCLSCCENYPHCLLDPELGCGDTAVPIPESNNDCNECCPNWPECLNQANIGCGLPDDFFNDPPIGGGDPPTDDPIEPPCEPGSPNFPDCLLEYDDPGTPGQGPGNLTTISDCGCEVFADERMPGGCVQVYDNALEQLEGVRDVEVIVKDDWFSTIKTSTDANGCFKVNRRHYGKIVVAVKFKNSRAIIRGTRGLRFWDFADAVKNKNHFNGANYNNIQIQYWPETNNSKNNRMYWYAAHANNALHEYYDFAAQDGIAPPPGGLSIFLSNFDGAASASMLNQMQSDPVTVAGSIIGALYILRIIPNSIINTSAPLGVYLSTFPPDIAYAYGDDGNRASDRVKRTFYHEYGHAAHYNALNDDGYWMSNVLYILAHSVPWATAPPYGDGTAQGAERIAVIEAWAYFIGPMYADRQYGLNHTNTISPDPLIINRRRHIFLLEEFSPVAAPGSSNAIDPLHAWIPEGLFLDCIDDNTQNPGNVIDFVNDPIMGYTISDCFESILGSPQTIQEVNNEMLERLPAGQLPVDLDLLFQEYGY